MSDTAKMDHEMTEHNGTGVAQMGASLGRQVTVALSPEQYERLFFQPSAPRRGDLAKRFGMSTSNMRTRRETTTDVSRQSIAAGPDRFPGPIYVHHLHPLRLPRSRSPTESGRPYRRLLFLRCFCHERRWYR
jgi:hypothetical protein